MKEAFGGFISWRESIVRKMAYIIIVFSIFHQSMALDLKSNQTLNADESENIVISPSSENIDITPKAHDEEIKDRLQKVLEATKWFTNPKVRVDEGVVFLEGGAPSTELKKWASELAQNTQDVVAVANKLEISKRDTWDFQPAITELSILWHSFINSLPLIVVGMITLGISIGLGIMATKSAMRIFEKRLSTKLLQKVFSRFVGSLVFLTGVYILLRVSGLTQLAMTLVGGTGLLGIAVGIAFRDITENFLASIFLSFQKPFETGDLVEILGVTGYVQQLNMRVTILMTLEGTIVQIPNSGVFKNNLRNFTSNCNRREDFIVGIGYEDSIVKAQEIARNVLVNHPAILNDPEPLVLADNLGMATVNLRVYFWLNGKEHSWLKVRSSAIRLVKLAFQQNGISMPDEAREVIFPQLTPYIKSSEEASRHSAKPSEDLNNEAVSTKAEAGLYSDANNIEKQAMGVTKLKHEENLLKNI